MVENPQSAPMSDPGLFDKWRGWLGMPQNRAALLQTGLSLLQPVQPGQSQFGHIASSIGQGLGAAGRAEARIAGEERDQAKLDREIEGEALDREIKRSGQELDRLNTMSQIEDRTADRSLARARLGNDTRLTNAQIANYESQSETREGGLDLRRNAEQAKQTAVADKQRLEQEKLALAQEVAKARAVGDETRARQAEAKIKQTDTQIALSAKKVAEAEAKAQNITLQSMFKNKQAIAKDVWEAANDPYAPNQVPMEELIRRRVELDSQIDSALGMSGQRGQSTGQQPPPSPTPSTAEKPRIKRNPKTGEQVILRDGQWVRYP